MSAFSPAVVALAAAMFFRMFGVFVALPIIAPLARELPGNPAAWAIGVAVGAYGVTQALCQIPAGALADRIGRKPALAGALALFILGSIVCANANHITALILGRLLQGTGAVAAIAAAWVADLAPPEKRPQAMAAFGGAIGIAFVVSLFAAAPLAGITGTDGVFAVAAAAGILSLILVLPLPSPRIAEKASSIRGAFRSPQLKMCAFGGFVLHYAMAALFLQIPLALSETLPLPQHWKVYIPAFALSLIPAVPLLMKVGKKHSRAFPVAVALTAVGFVAALTGGANPWNAGFGMFLFFSGFVVLEAALPAAASALAPEGGRGAAMGFLMTCEFFGVFCGGAVSGILLHFAGPAAMAVVGAALFCAWLAALFLSRSRSHPTHSPTPPPPPPT